MTLDQLKYFYEAARFQHVGKAAKAVHISPSAISSAIASLEEEFGVLLFDRVGKSIFLTDSGKRLQKETESLLDQFEGMKLRVTGMDHDLRGQYRLGASHFLASSVLTKAWNDLQKKNSKLIGEICSLPSSNVIADVVSGALDFGLCFSSFKHPELNQEEIYKGQLQVTVRHNHPLTKMKLDSRKNCKVLSDYPAALHKARAGIDTCEHHPVFDEFQIEPKPNFLFDSDSCAVEKLIHSDAWALIPDIVVSHYSKQIQKLEMPNHWDAPYTVSVVMRRDRMRNIVLLKIKEQVFRKMTDLGWNRS